MAKNTFLEYYKTILEKVSFDQALLMKEYQKALQALHPPERIQLNQWIHENGLIEKITSSNRLANRAKVL